MRIILLLFLLVSTVLSAQTNNLTKENNYLEDQIYIGLNYINAVNLPGGVRQNGFSNSLSFGFIKDIPINKKRNVAFGIGLGYGHNTYFQNLKIYTVNNSTVFEILDGVDYEKNKFSSHTLEIPLEFRWRDSSIDKYKFWRLYIGAKLSYAFLTKAKFKDKESKTKIVGIPEFNNFQYGLTLAAGHGVWNFNFYYGLSDLLSNANINATTPVVFRDFRLGFIFYIF